jgi:CubicO group peptidase (beta-lactamase class C family)
LPDGAPYKYSNLGVGLLGHALARRAGASYEALLRAEVTGPLGMHETVVTLTPPLRARLAAGHDAEHKPARPWDFTALVGAGGIRSTASDMLLYLDAQLHPDHLPAAVLARPNGKTLAAAIARTHMIHAAAGEGQHIALNWMHSDESGSYWHNGATGGYSSDAIWNLDDDLAVIVLSATSDPAGFADTVAMHVVARLRGKPARSLAAN